MLLKLLSDSSERVLRADLQLLAQISSLGDGSGGSSGEDYFAGLMTSLLELFSTDRKLLETRGSLIIRQLCGTLDAERIYRTCAEILETDEVSGVADYSLFTLQRTRSDVRNSFLSCAGSRIRQHHGAEPELDHDHLARTQRIPEETPHARFKGAARVPMLGCLGTDVSCCCMQDGQNLFVTLYRSWSLNAVSTFTLCLLAQAYEQASALLQIL